MHDAVTEVVAEAVTALRLIRQSASLAYGGANGTPPPAPALASRLRKRRRDEDEADSTGERRLRPRDPG